MHQSGPGSSWRGCRAGVATLVAPAVRVLDTVYATRITLEDLAERYGNRPLEWPAHIVEQLKERNTAILVAIEGSICSMSAGLYYPLGAQPVPASSSVMHCCGLLPFAEADRRGMSIAEHSTLFAADSFVS